MHVRVSKDGRTPTKVGGCIHVRVDNMHMHAGEERRQVAKGGGGAAP